MRVASAIRLRLERARTRSERGDIPSVLTRWRRHGQVRHFSLTFFQKAF
jgi:hypothetical protein